MHVVQARIILEQRLNHLRALLPQGGSAASSHEVHIAKAIEAGTPNAGGESKAESNVLNASNLTIGAPAVISAAVNPAADTVLFTHSQGFTASLDAMKLRGDTALFEGVHGAFDRVCEELART